MAFGIKKILCPVALDDQCAASLRLSIRLARDFRAELFVCFCTPRAAAGIPPAQHRKINEMIERALDFYAGSVDEGTISWQSVVIESGDTAKGIIDEAARQDADLIVMGASRHPILHALLGSVTEKVCRTAPCSVLVTPSGDPSPPAAGEESFRRILVAHDFSDYSEIALQTATALTMLYKAELYLFQVITETPRQEPELVWSRAARNPYHKTIERLKTVVTGEFKKVPRVVIAARWGKPYREILTYSREHEVDLIAMGAQGADFGSNTLFGSNVDRVLRQSSCAVLVARPHRPVVNGNGKLES
ncbi:MAG: universal stress protein [Acidobacteria bacterium]|nr:universal stress protein [Acidobacteriota bacterium]